MVPRVQLRGMKYPRAGGCQRLPGGLPWDCRVPKVKVMNTAAVFETKSILVLWWWIYDTVFGRTYRSIQRKG